MPAPRLLLVAATTGYEARRYRDAAAWLGVEVILASNRCRQLENPWGDAAIPVRFEDPKGALELVRARGPYQGIAACGDRAAVLAARLAAGLGLRYHSVRAAESCHDKTEFKQVLHDAALPAPWFRREKLSADPAVVARAVTYPCVLKPPMLSASRGVIRANNAAEFQAAFERIRKLLLSGELKSQTGAGGAAIMIEGYIEGREFALDGWMAAGVLQRFAMFDKPDPLTGPYFEETLYVTPSRLETEKRAMIWDMVEAAARAAGLGPGPIHAEIRLQQEESADNAYVLEIAPRAIGGLCGRALRFERTGPDGATARASLEELLIRGALGEPLGGWVREAAASGVMMIPIPHSGVLESVEGVDAARQTQVGRAKIEDVEITAKLGAPLLCLPEGSSYLGFIFAQGREPENVEAVLRAAHAQLHVHMRDSLPLV